MQGTSQIPIDLAEYAAIVLPRVVAVAVREKGRNTACSYHGCTIHLDDVDVVA